MASMDRLSTLTMQQYQEHAPTALMYVLSAKACAQWEGGVSPEEHYRQRRGDSELAPLVLRAFEWERTQSEALTKAAVLPGTSTDATWAKPLVAPSKLTDAFLRVIQRESVLGKMPVTPAPFQTPLAYQISGASMRWVGEASPKPVTKLGFGTATLTPTKGAGIIVLTAELMKLSAPAAAPYVEQTLINELTAFTDATLLSAAAATPESPAGILNGVTVSASIAAAVDAFGVSRPRAFTPTWIVSPANLGKLTLDTSGRLKNYPVVTSPDAGANLILVDAPALIVADDGVTLDTSDQALLEMNDAPTVPSAATLYVSLWQQNMVGIRVERIINWKVVPGAVQFTATFS